MRGGDRRSRIARVSLPLLLAAGIGVVPGPGGAAAAQEALDAVESLAATGRTGEARQRLVSWWEDAADAASRLEIQRALWLRGRLSTDDRDAERAYQRLVVEYPGGEYTARALFRLGQLSHARGDLPGAAERFQTVVRDHAETPQRLEALRWLERNGGRAEELAALGSAPGPASPVAEREEQAVAAPRVEADPTPESNPESAAEAEEPPDTEVGPPAAEVGPPAAAERPAVEIAEPPSGREAGTLAVQVGAFSRLDGARTLAARVEGEGLTARLVRIPGSELVRVRVGRFRDAEEAEGMQATLRRLGFETALVSNAHHEVPIR